MERTKLKDRALPSYTKGEEIFNMVSHIVGGALGVAALVLCVVFAAVSGNVWGVVSGSIYGATLVVLYTMSSIYHGIRPPTAKKVLQVIDHCSIYFLIAGTYTPIVLGQIRAENPFLGWTLFGVVWGGCALGVIFTAIDLKKYKLFSMICYLVMGWCVVFVAKPVAQIMPMGFILWILGGGVAYTIGAVLYVIGHHRPYFHSIFHLFVVAGSVLQFFGILFYIMIG